MRRESSSHDLAKPLLFVAMPFGMKAEPGGARRVDFDSVYERCIGPAARAAGAEVIRADEETLGGIVHRPMYERLLLAEIVVADLTFANANVFYELGVRHAARPRSTILICADVGHLPFDVGLIRAIQYELDASGALTNPDGVREALVEHIEVAISEEVVDSPLFQLLDDYPGVSLPHEATEAFRERALWISDLTIRANDVVKPENDRESAIRELAKIEDEAGAAVKSEEQLLITLLLSYRAVEEWGEMIRVAESLEGRGDTTPILRQQLAMALSRRGERGDRSRAIEILGEVIDQHGESPETLGILGRCYKARWRAKLENDDHGAADALDEAIDVYRRGFESDPRDFYPGINLITLLVCRGTPDDLVSVDEVAPVVSFAVARKGGLRSRDYWTLATMLELAVVRRQPDIARSAVSAMLDTEPEGWMKRTTADNLGVLARAPSLSAEQYSLIGELEAKLCAHSPDNP